MRDDPLPAQPMRLQQQLERRPTEQKAALAAGVELRGHDLRLVRIGAGRVLVSLAARLAIADAAVPGEFGAGPRLGVLRQRAGLGIETQGSAMRTQIYYNVSYGTTCLDTGLHHDRDHTELLQQRYRFGVLPVVDQRPKIAGMMAQRALQVLCQCGEVVDLYG